ncbi:MAG: O-antigen polymerase [Mucilaginibacter sp.]
MSHFEFYDLVYEHYVVYIALLVLFILFFVYIGKNYTHTWFDPLRLYLLSAAFTAVVPVFLYVTDSIGFNIAAYFTLAQLFFWLAFLLTAKRKLPLSRNNLTNEKAVAFILYLAFLILYFISIGLSYILLGIPIFKESRLDTYTGSGLGILERLMPFFQIYCIFYSFYLWRNSSGFSKKRILTILSFCLFVVTGILSGSRSSFFIFLFVFWGYSYYYIRDTTAIKKNYKFIIWGIIVSLVTFSVQSGTYNILASMSSFGLRAISSGDNYYMALPNDMYKQVETGPWFNHLFYGLLGPLHIISGDGMPPPIGFQLTWLVNPSLYGQSTGPLSSPALLGFVYFRWGGLIFSAILGLFVSLVIFRLPTLLPKGIISSVLSTYIYIEMLSFIGDPCLGMAYLFDIMLNFTFLLMLILLINKLSEEKVV